jgi:hypothetical protein
MVWVVVFIFCVHLCEITDICMRVGLQSKEQAVTDQGDDAQYLEGPTFEREVCMSVSSHAALWFLIFVPSEEKHVMCRVSHMYVCTYMHTYMHVAQF